MTAPRKNTDFVNAPVLFRLPNLHAWQAHCQPECAPAELARGPMDAEHAASLRNSQHAVADLPESRSSGPQQSAHSRDLNTGPATRAVDSPSALSTREIAAEPLVLQRPEFFAKRSVILLAMTVVACGAWLAGRHSSQQPHYEIAVPAEIAAQTPTSDTVRAEVADAMKVAVRSKPATPPANLPERQSHYRAQESLANDSNDFYLADDVTVVAKESLESKPLAAPSSQRQTPARQSVDESTSIASRSDADEAIDPNAIFAALSLGALAPPANHPTPQHSESGSEQRRSNTAQTAVLPETTTAESELQLEGDLAATAQSQDVAQSPAAELTGDAADIQLSDSANAADSEAGQSEPSQDQSPKLRRVLSATPYDIPDWSVYFPGASGSVRAASAESMLQPPNQSAQMSRQAVYRDSDASF